MANPPPAPAPKKRGLGCCGCGCLILALLAVLFLGLGAVVYMVDQGITGLTSPIASTVPSFDGGDEMYNSARQKWADFHHDLDNHQAATIRLSADEINTLIARNPDFAKNNIHMFVTLPDGEARIQSSAPTSILSHGLLPDRYMNSAVSFGIHFDAAEKNIDFDPHGIEIGDKVVFGPGAEGSSNKSEEAFNQAFLKWFMPIFNQMLDQEFRKDPEKKVFLDRAKSIEFKDNALVIEIE